MKLKDQYSLLKQVFEEGKILQMRKNGKWKDINPNCNYLSWDLFDGDYRIKPDPRKVWVKELSGFIRPYHKNDDKDELELLGWVLYEQVQ